MLLELKKMGLSQFGPLKLPLHLSFKLSTLNARLYSFDAFYKPISFCSL
jgi:hypothetical protein